MSDVVVSVPKIWCAWHVTSLRYQIATHALICRSYSSSFGKFLIFGSLNTMANSVWHNNRIQNIFCIAIQTDNLPVPSTRLQQYSIHLHTNMERIRIWQSLPWPHLYPHLHLHCCMVQLHDEKTWHKDVIKIEWGGCAYVSWVVYGLCDEERCNWNDSVQQMEPLAEMMHM